LRKIPTQSYLQRRSGESDRTDHDSGPRYGGAFVVSGGGGWLSGYAHAWAAPRIPGAAQAEVAMPRKLATPCSVRSCPNLKPCPDHVVVRASRQARGYDRGHELRREALKPAVEAGLKRCARCGRPILPGQEWALDHTDDRKGYLGPSHASCNNQAGGKAAHR
jgi:hypothetical protein